MPMKNLLSMKTILILLLLGCVAYFIYGLYQQSNAEEERLRSDAHRIETMILEKNEIRP